MRCVRCALRLDAITEHPQYHWTLIVLDNNVEATLMRNKLGAKLTLMVAFAAVWYLCGPFFWAYNTYQHIDHTLISYAEFLSLYVPELAVGAVFLLCLPMIFLRPRFAVAGLLFAAILMPILEFTFGSPATAWPPSMLFLLFLSWRIRAANARQA